MSRSQAAILARICLGFFVAGLWLPLRPLDRPSRLAGRQVQGWTAPPRKKRSRREGVARELASSILAEKTAPGPIPSKARSGSSPHRAGLGSPRGDGRTTDRPAGLASSRLANHLRC